MATSISMFMNTAPFEDVYGVTKDQYKSIESMLDREIIIEAVKPYTKDGNPGVYILAKFNGVMGAELFYTATHAVGLTSILSKPEVMETLQTDSIVATIVKRKSTKSDRMVYAFKFDN